MVDVSESLPSLIRRPGLTKWLPTVGRDLKYFDTYEHYVASLPGGKGAARLTRSHWPPAEELGLERWYVRLAEQCSLASNEKQYTHISAPTGHRRVFHCCNSAQAINSHTKVRVAYPSAPHACSIFGTREGKRAVEEAAEEPNVKKVRLDSGEGVVMAPVTEPSTSKCNSHLVQTHDPR